MDIKLPKGEVARLVSWLDQLATFGEQIDIAEDLFEGFSAARLAALRGTNRAAIFHVRGLLVDAGLENVVLSFEALCHGEITDPESTFQCPICGNAEGLQVDWVQMYEHYGPEAGAVPLTDFVFCCDDCGECGTFLELTLGDYGNE